MTEYVYLDGAFLPSAEAVLPALSRAVLYGEGLCETLRSYGGRAFGLEAHLARLTGSARELGIPIPGDFDAVAAKIPGLLERNGMEDGVVRVSVLSGISEAGPGASGPGGAGTAVSGPGGRAGSSHLLISTRPLPPGLDAEQRRGVAVVTWKAGSLPMAAHKTTAYLRSIQAARAGTGQGARETLLLDDADRVLEGAASNVFAIFGGELVTPPLDNRVLPGITRSMVVDIARARGLHVLERELPVREIARAEGLFLTNAVVEILPAVSLDGRPVGNGAPLPVARELLKLYRMRVASATGAALTSP